MANGCFYAWSGLVCCAACVPFLSCSCARRLRFASLSRRDSRPAGGCGFKGRFFRTKSRRVMCARSWRSCRLTLCYSLVQYCR